MKPRQPHEISWIIEEKIRNGPYTEAVKIDIDRMKVAMESDTIQVPPGLSRDEKIAFILAHGNEENERKQ